MRNFFRINVRYKTSNPQRLDKLNIILSQNNDATASQIP